MRLAGVLPAALNLTRLDVDIEAADESGDELVAEAALAQDLDLPGEQGDDFGVGIALGVSARGFAELAGSEGDLVDGVGFLAGRHGGFLRVCELRMVTGKRIERRATSVEVLSAG